MIPKIYISIKRGIESCKTETAGYTSCLDIGFIIEFRTESMQNCVCKFGYPRISCFDAYVRYIVNGA